MGYSIKISAPGSARQVAATNADAKDKDLALWREWKKTNSPLVLQQLLNQMNPIINREVNKWSNAMSRSLLEAEAKRLAVEAFKEYDPKKGVALSTFVASRLPKISRMVYSTQNTARLSESNALLMGTYNTAVVSLQEKHGRDPTSEELSDHLGWSPKKLKTFQKQVNRKEFIESEEHPELGGEESDNLIDFIYHDLNPTQKKIFEYSTGYMGSPVLSNPEIMKKLKITQGQLSYQKTQIVKIVEKVHKSHGR